ncbi:MAG: LacI family DNA-binding transcriptional regulator [Calditrichaceae bacterium]
MKKHVTLQDIADKLNISKVSVSKALRDHPDISAITKQRIADVAQKMGYMPNFIARNLSSRKSNTIGLVVPKIAHHFFASAIEAIYQTAYLNNYEIIMTVSQEDAEHEAKHIQTLLSMHVDGLLVSVTEQTKDKAIFELVKNSNIGYNRRKGFELAAKDCKLKIPKQWIIEGGFGETDGYNGFMQLYNKNDLPEVIFAVTYPVALGIQSAAQEVGLNIPKDLELISFGGSIYNRFIAPSITYINQPIQALGAKAIELIIEEIKNPDTVREQHITLPTELIICETCKKMIGN